MSPSGFFVKPTAIEPDDVQIFDVAHHLSNISRFTGGTCYSVAQHSVHVCDGLRDAGFDETYQLAGLLHDAAEAYIGDFAGPLKIDDELGPAFKRVERGIQRAIEEHFCLPHDSLDWAPVKALDVEMLNAEGYWLMPAPGNDWAKPAARWLREEVQVWGHEYAERAFLNRYTMLAAERARAI